MRGKLDVRNLYTGVNDVQGLDVTHGRHQPTAQFELAAELQLKPGDPVVSIRCATLTRAASIDHRKQHYNHFEKNYGV
jgi:hypothetical protein